MSGFVESLTDMEQYDQKVFSSFQTTFGAASNKISELHKELEILANFYTPPSTGIVVSDATSGSAPQNSNFTDGGSLPDMNHINIDVDGKNDSQNSLNDSDLNLNFSALNLNPNAIIGIAVNNPIQENTGITILVSLFIGFA